MALFSRKIGARLTKTPSSVIYCLLANKASNRHGICKHQFRALSSSLFVGHCSDNPSERAICFGATNRIQTNLFSILVQTSDPGLLGLEILHSLDEGNLEDAWYSCDRYMIMHGFPIKSVLTRILSTSAESLEAEWLEKAFELFVKVCEREKLDLIERETLLYLSYAFARSGFHNYAAIVLRKLLKMMEYPPVAVWPVIMAWMSQTGRGAYIVAELILLFMNPFRDNLINPFKKENAPLLAMKPNATALNVALAGCVLFGTTRKAEQILSMIDRIGVKADSDMMFLMAHIHERNGRIHELRKLLQQLDLCSDSDSRLPKKRGSKSSVSIDEARVLQIQNLYLSCCFKVGHLDSAANMVLEILCKAKQAQSSLGSHSVPTLGDKHSQASNINGSGSGAMMSYDKYLNDKIFVRLETEAKEHLCTMLAKVPINLEMLTNERGVIKVTENAYGKLVKGYLDAGKVKDLAVFLVKAEEESSPVSKDDSISFHVINTCISLGMLDQAHDLLEEIRNAGIKANTSLYSSLLRAYCKENRARDAASLLKDSRRHGIQLDSSSYEALIESKILQQDTSGAMNAYKEMKHEKIPKSTGHGSEVKKLVEACSEGGEAKMMTKLLEEVKDGQKADCGVHDWNNVIHYFSSRLLINDAEKALKKMYCLGHVPNCQTFYLMVAAYAAVGRRYKEVSQLWNEMKRLASLDQIKYDQEVLDSVLYVFVRGGFFGLANEVRKVMEENNMFVDSFKYKALFMRYHKKMYRGKIPKDETESQGIGRDEGLAFRKWIGLDSKAF